LNIPDEKDFRQQEKDKGRRRGSDKDYKRLFINLGKNHKLNAQRLMGLVNEATRERNIPVGKIDIMKSFSFFEVDKQYTDKVLDGLNNAIFEGVKVSTEIAKERPKGGSPDRSDRRDDKKRSSGRRDDKKSFEGDRSRKRSGKPGGDKKPRRKR